MNRKVLGQILLVLGAVLGLGMASLALWAEIEASQYGFLRYTTTRLTSLRCPVFIGPQETLPIRATVVNQKADYRARFTVRITKSSPTFFETETERFRLDPGERKVLQWTVGPENIDMGHFIFVDVYQFGGYPNPTRQSQCGIFVLPFSGLSGKGALWGGGLLTLALLWGGWWLGRRGPRGREDNMALTRVLDALVILIPVSMAAAFWGPWLLAAPLVVLDLLCLLGVALFAVVRVE